MEEQVADAELDEIEELTDQDDESEGTVAIEAAPQCAGCHRRGVDLTLLENGKRYCERCAHEVERLMGIGPLFPAAEAGAEETEATDDAPAALETVEDLPAASTEVTLAGTAEVDGEPPTVEPAVAEPPIAEPAVETAVASTDPVTPPIADAPPVADTPSVADTPPVDDTPSPAPLADVELPSGDDAVIAAVPDVEPEAAASVSAAVPPAKPAADDADLATIVANANREAAEAADSLIPRPEITTAKTPEEPPLMERVQEQTRPVPLETSASAVAPPPSDLLGALSAERTRLLDQRELLEARFRAETEVIDERLLHVESLLGDQNESIAS